jgi:hypothetical protein
LIGIDIASFPINLLPGSTPVAKRRSLRASPLMESADAKGRSSYSGEGLNLASFRESSELEFGADDAFILHPDGDDAEGDIYVTG